MRVFVHDTNWLTCSERRKLKCLMKEEMRATNALERGHTAHFVDVIRDVNKLIVERKEKARQTRATVVSTYNRLSLSDTEDEEEDCHMVCLDMKEKFTVKEEMDYMRLQITRDSYLRQVEVEAAYGTSPSLERLEAHLRTAERHLDEFKRRICRANANRC